MTLANTFSTGFFWSVLVPLRQGLVLLVPWSAGEEKCNGTCLALPTTMPGLCRKGNQATVSPPALCHSMFLSNLPSLLCNLPSQPSCPLVASTRSVVQALKTSQGKQTLVQLRAVLGKLNTTKGSGSRDWHCNGSRAGCNGHNARALWQKWMLMGSPAGADEERRHWVNPNGLQSKRELR